MDKPEGARNMPHIQDEGILQIENIEELELEGNFFEIENILQEFSQMEDVTIQDFIREALFRSAELSVECGRKDDLGQQDSNMLDDLIRFFWYFDIKFVSGRRKIKKRNSRYTAYGCI